MLSIESMTGSSTMMSSCRDISRSYARISSNPLSFLDGIDRIQPQIESLLHDLRQLNSGGSNPPDLVDTAVRIISKIKTSKGLSLSVNHDATARHESSKSSHGNPRATVEDRFFKLSELEDFLNQQDQEFERQQDVADPPDSDDEQVDLFNDQSDSDAEMDVMFADFFDAPNESAHPESNASDADFDEEDVDEGSDEDIDTEDFTPTASGSSGQDRDMVVASDSESEESEDGEPKSSYQKKKEAEDQKIRNLEKEMLSRKSWQLTGEVDAAHRPANSLLEEHLQFDFLSRQAQLVTEDFTHRIEDIIRQRIKNESWDDVVRKTKPTEQAFEFKRRITLEQEKSKTSLAQVYEKEFLKSSGQAGEEREDPSHAKIKRMARTLYAKLDALSSFHFTPRLPEPELKIINNLPAVSVEEAIPSAVSESTLLAPEEVSRKEKRELMSTTEKTSTDRKRDRRAKKKFQKAKKLFVQNKSKAACDPVSQNKYVKLEREKAVANALKKLPAEKLTDSKAIRSSKSFFAQLDEKVTQVKTGKTNTLSKTNTRVNSKLLKL